jgi:hypothetical protein
MKTISTNKTKHAEINSDSVQWYMIIIMNARSHTKAK